MNLTINGKPKQMDQTGNLSELVTAFYKQPKHVITELNGTIVPHSQWANTHIKEGDVLELVTFVGGG